MDTGRERWFVPIMHQFIRDESLSADAKLLGIVYASFADRGRKAWPGVATLQAKTGFGRDRLKRAREELVRGGFLIRRRERRGGGQFSRVIYEVSAELLWRKRTPTPLTEATHHCTGIQASGKFPANLTDPRQLQTEATGLKTRTLATSQLRKNH